MTRRRIIETIRVSAYLLAMCLIMLVAAMACLAAPQVSSPTATSLTNSDGKRSLTEPGGLFPTGYYEMSSI
jgi:hypothetical protein